MGKIIIMGPGRCGTTVLVQLLQAMGYDTGGCHEIFREKRTEIATASHFQWPHVIKGTGTLCVGLNRWVEEQQWKVDFIFFCKRELEANVQSMMKKKRGGRDYRQLTPEQFEARIRSEVPAGYKQAQENLDKGGFRYEVVWFPQSAKDPDYTFEKLRLALPDLDRVRFDVAWKQVVRPELIRFGG